MKNASLILAGFILLGFVSCNNSDESGDTQQVQDTMTTAEIQPEEAVNYTPEEKEAIVNKGGPKDSDQMVLEDLLAELEASVNQKKGTDFETMLGHWTGSFGKNKINLTITSMDEETKIVEGYSVCAGNFRSLYGSYSLAGNTYSFILNEPGDDRYDGKFEFTIEKRSLIMSGNWTPFEAKGNTAKDYVLAKREFKYDPEMGEFNASTDVLEHEDVENESIENLTLMRNEIYARHGYCFKDKDMRYHFEQQDWYMPMGVDIRHELTDIEIANIALIYEYEEYYELYTDDFGR